MLGITTAMEFPLCKLIKNSINIFQKEIIITKTAFFFVKGGVNYYGEIDNFPLLDKGYRYPCFTCKI